MKKLFTLLVGVLLAGSAYGQSKWTTIFDQDFENNLRYLRSVLLTTFF